MNIAEKKVYRTKNDEPKQHRNDDTLSGAHVSIILCQIWVTSDAARLSGNYFRKKGKSSAAFFTGFHRAPMAATLKYPASKKSLQELNFSTQGG